MKQHYVPKVYLKNFGKKNKRNYTIEVYDKQEKKFFKVLTDNILSITNLYTLDLPNKKSENPLIVENVYSDFIEPMFDRAMKILFDEKRTYINNFERSEIIISILHLLYRNPHVFSRMIDEHIINIQNLYDEALKANKSEFHYLDETYIIENFNIEVIRCDVSSKIEKIFRENHLDLTAAFSEMHEFLIIEVHTIEDDSTFFTNDNPIFFEDITFNKSNNPFKKTVEFSLPLSKKHFVKLFHDKNMIVNYIYRQKISNFSVSLINNETISKAKRFVICNENDYQKFLEHKEVIDDTSIHRKMDFLKQIIEDCERGNNKDDTYYLLKLYYEKYKKQNNDLSKIDEYIMMQEFKKLNAKNKISKI
ncbi:DUF4238 domain-containing protein [Elizabethkingia sp. M8]|uniref:DUF4238 domain-containing protein n=1 Tax=Elizabethkingia sp. M8 TaxID=2796140 RepID=UPI001905AF4B|nr:DUF4238 domain-containing protein [Elizabethkingia sp. M8]QQM25334.1 DUF4238 domain-containing protein [Elizabethkingia sp. M8]